MKWAVGRFAVVEGVLPAADEVAWLTLAVLDVLAEVDNLFRGHFESDCLTQVVEG